ncbi:MAG: PGPGW domain-containing protein [Nitrospirae bacterium]|nr:PGPGW domain-containing protein [Nitrospirota bacterium]
MIALLLKSIKQAKRLIIGVAGFTVMLIGIVMIVLPGPAIIVIPIGLGILATEFVWARNLLRKVKTRFKKMKEGGIYGKETE